MKARHIKELRKVIANFKEYEVSYSSGLFGDFGVKAGECCKKIMARNPQEAIKRYLNMKMYIARDSNNALWFHNLKPQLEHNPILNIDYWISRGNYYEVDQDLFPEVTFENSPMEVELKLIEK